VNILKRFSILAIVIGIIVDMVGTMIVSSIFTVIYVMANHIDISNIKELYTNNLFISLNMIIGAIFSTFGGFVAARIAKQSKLMNSAIIGIACEMEGIYTIFNGKSLLPTWYHVTAFIITIPLTLYGGFLAIKFKKNKKDVDI
jgi:hypothetical protein